MFVLSCKKPKENKDEGSTVYNFYRDRKKKHLKEGRMRIDGCQMGPDCHVLLDAWATASPVNCFTFFSLHLPFVEMVLSLFFFLSIQL